jgi:hypothetical protein
MIDWTQRAREALGVPEPFDADRWRSASTGDRADFKGAERYVPTVAAALAQAYGEGLGKGRGA